jgi:hypothetical protein
MFIPDPDFYPFRVPDPRSRIPDPKTATKERGEKKLFYFLNAEESLGQFSKNFRLFTQKICH